MELVLMIGRFYQIITFFSLTFLCIFPLSATELLTDDALGEVFKCLPVKSVGCCASVCKQWQQTSSQDGVWEALAKAHEENGGRFKGFLNLGISTDDLCLALHYLGRSWKSIIRDEVEVEDDPSKSLWKFFGKTTFADIQTAKKSAHLIQKMFLSVPQESYTLNFNLTLNKINFDVILPSLLMKETKEEPNLESKSNPNAGRKLPPIPQPTTQGIEAKIAQFQQYIDNSSKKI
jgi:hypothetical protein